MYLQYRTLKISCVWYMIKVPLPRKVVDSLVREQRLESVRLGVDAGPEQVEICGGLMKAMGMAQRAHKLGIRVGGLETQAELLSHPRVLLLVVAVVRTVVDGHSRAIEHDDGHLLAIDAGLVG